MRQLYSTFSFWTGMTIVLVLMYLIWQAFPSLNRAEKRMINQLQPLLEESLKVSKKGNLHRRNETDATLRGGWGNNIINGIDSILDLSNRHIQQFANYQIAQNILQKDTSLYMHYYINVGFDGKRSFGDPTFMQVYIDRFLDTIFVLDHAFSEGLATQLLKNKTNFIATQMISHLSSSFGTSLNFPDRRLNINWKNINVPIGKRKGEVYVSPFYNKPQKVVFQLNGKVVVPKSKYKHVPYTFTESGVQPLIITANLDHQILQDTVFVHVK